MPDKPKWKQKHYYQAHFWVTSGFLALPRRLVQSKPRKKVSEPCTDVTVWGCGGADLPTKVVKSGSHPSKLRILTGSTHVLLSLRWLPRSTALAERQLMQQLVLRWEPALSSLMPSGAPRKNTRSRKSRLQSSFGFGRYFCIEIFFFFRIKMCMMNDRWNSSR